MRFTPLVLTLAIIACKPTLGHTPGVVFGPPMRTSTPGAPGFDTRHYPGDDAMKTWREASPYKWVGYYLQAPCFTNTSWTGKRASLSTAGWGLAVVYIGEQDWNAALTVAPTDSAAQAVRQGTHCTTMNLTPQNGAAHAAAADSAMSAEGFTKGNIIFLDVELVHAVSPALAGYVRSWVATMLDQGHFLPGLYVHDNNARELYAVANAEFNRRQRRDAPPLWVAKASGFNIVFAPMQSGVADATVWQGVFNKSETWGGVTLTIDVDVANTASPSTVR
jgi:hypothetical protein